MQGTPFLKKRVAVPLCSNEALDIDEAIEYVSAGGRAGAAKLSAEERSTSPALLPRGATSSNRTPPSQCRRRDAPHTLVKCLNGHLGLRVKLERRRSSWYTYKQSRNRMHQVWLTPIASLKSCQMLRSTLDVVTGGILPPIVGGMD